MLRSLALLLTHAFDRNDLADALDESVDATLRSHPTPDLGGTATTTEFGNAVVARLEESWSTALS
jgi:3-isopropylmalate dehydrogenase